MKSFIVASALAAIALVPSCPAPPAFIPGIIAGAAGGLAGGITDIVVNNPNVSRRDLMRHDRRQITLPPGVSQYALSQCTDSMAGIAITVTDKGANSFVLEGVPAPCMNLATLFAGEGAHPVPCGSACLTYDNLNDSDARLLWGAIHTLQNAS